MYHVAGPARSGAKRSLPDHWQRDIPLPAIWLFRSSACFFMTVLRGYGGGNLATSTDTSRQPTPPPHPRHPPELLGIRRRSPAQSTPGTAALTVPARSRAPRMAIRAAVGWRRRCWAQAEICSRPPTLSTIRHRASTMSDDGMNIDDGMFSHHFILAPYSLPIHPGGVVRRKGRGFQSAAGMFE